MHIILAAIGKAKAGLHTQQLFEEYVGRLPWFVAVKEFEEKRPLPTPQRKAKEAEFLLGACEDCNLIIALDERGKELTSVQFAELFRGWQREGETKIGFVIGGQDGLDESVRKKARISISFGKMTWPHLLVRALLAEQLYRAHTILTNHPYHREG